MTKIKPKISSIPKKESIIILPKDDTRTEKEFMSLKQVNNLKLNESRVFAKSPIPTESKRSLVAESDEV